MLMALSGSRQARNVPVLPLFVHDKWISEGDMETGLRGYAKVRSLECSYAAKFNC